MPGIRGEAPPPHPPCAERSRSPRQARHGHAGRGTRCAHGAAAAGPAARTTRMDGEAPLQFGLANQGAAVPLRAAGDWHRLREGFPEAWAGEPAPAGGTGTEHAPRDAGGSVRDAGFRRGGVPLPRKADPVGDRVVREGIRRHRRGGPNSDAAVRSRRRCRKAAARRPPIRSSGDAGAAPRSSVPCRHRPTGCRRVQRASTPPGRGDRLVRGGGRAYGRGFRHGMAGGRATSRTGFPARREARSRKIEQNAPRSRSRHAATRPVGRRERRIAGRRVAIHPRLRRSRQKMHR